MAYKYRYTEKYKGKRIDLRANSQKELMAKVKNKKAQIDEGLIDGSASLTALAAEYLEAYKANTVSPRWYADMSAIVSNRIIKVLGDVPISTTSAFDVQRMLNTTAGMSKSYIKKVYDLTCQLWRYAYRVGYIRKDLTPLFELPNGKDPVIGRSLTDDERDALLKVLDGHRGEVFCKLMLYCGLRPSEVRALQWADIDLKNMVVSVTKSCKRDGSIGPCKTKTSVRQVPIPLHLKSLLKAKSGAKSAYVVNQRHDWYRKMWANVKREMDIEMGATMYRNAIIESKINEPLNLYYFRHTYCTDLEKSGVPINIASRLMGHSDISITSKIYTHGSTEAFEMARKLIDARNVAKSVAK